MSTHTVTGHAHISSFAKWLIAVVGCEAVGLISGLMAQPEMSTWFLRINKPAWQPADWIFGPVWTFLYFLMGTSLWMVWKSDAEPKKIKEAFSVFGLQLFFNFSWSILFFNLHSPLWALVDIFLLVTMIIVTMIQFATISRPASLLLTPYLSWVCFATVLNYHIWMLN